MLNYINLILAFFKCGIFGFGGGQATVPLVENEVVSTYGWLTIEEFSDVYAFGNSLPGPIVTKLAALVGYKIGGLLGALVAILSLVLPSALGMILLFTIYLNNKEAEWLQGMMKGVRPVVVILSIQVLYKIMKSAYIAKGTESILKFGNINLNFLIYTVLISVVAGVLLFKFDVHPIILIVLSLIVGGVFL